MKVALTFLPTLAAGVMADNDGEGFSLPSNWYLYWLMELGLFRRYVQEIQQVSDLRNWHRELHKTEMMHASLTLTLNSSATGLMGDYVLLMVASFFLTAQTRTVARLTGV